MSSDAHAGTDRRCPRCHRRYAFRVPRRLDDAMNLKTHYRCTTYGRYVYVHRIEYEPATPAVRLPYDVQTGATPLGARAYHHFLTTGAPPRI